MRWLLCLLLMVSSVRAYDEPDSGEVRGAFEHSSLGRNGSARALEALKVIARKLDDLSVALKTAKAEREAAVAERDKREAQNEQFLEEYRNGQFCSGCKKFRSQFAPGETFPHSGQVVLRPTAEEIEEKVEEFRRELRPFEERAERLTAQIAALEKRVKPILDQLHMGKIFWLNACHLDEVLIRDEGKKATGIVVDERAACRQRRQVAEAAYDRERDPTRREEWSKQVAAAREEEARCERRLRAITLRKNSLWGDATSVSGAEVMTFNQYSLSLKVFNDVPLTPGFLDLRGTIGSSFQTAGGYFLMGETPEIFTGKTVPLVKEVVETYLHLTSIHMGFVSDYAPAAGFATQEDAKEALRRAAREERERQRAEEQGTPRPGPVR